MPQDILESGLSIIDVSAMRNLFDMSLFILLSILLLSLTYWAVLLYVAYLHELKSFTN